MRAVSLWFLVLFGAVAASGQWLTRPLLTLCDVLTSPNRYHKKVIYLTAVLDSHIEGWLLRPGRSCATGEGVAVTTDEDYNYLNNPEERDRFDQVLNPLLFVPEDKLHISRYSFVLRTQMKLKLFHCFQETQTAFSTRINTYSTSARSKRSGSRGRLT